jgi:hypothetical protein
MKDSRQVSSGNMVMFSLLLVTGIVLRSAFSGNERWYWLLLALVPMLVIMQRVGKRKR